MYDNANIKITKTKVQALEQAIQNANITKTQVDNVINYFNYNKLFKNLNIFDFFVEEAGTFMVTYFSII